jgi:hypothetical protein
MLHTGPTFFRCPRCFFSGSGGEAVSRGGMAGEASGGVGGGSMDGGIL